MTDGWLNCIPQSRQLKAKSMRLDSLSELPESLRGLTKAFSLTLATRTFLEPEEIPLAKLNVIRRKVICSEDSQRTSSLSHLDCSSPAV
jgi:hypothetical protein